MSDEPTYTRRELLEGMRLHEILEDVDDTGGIPPVFGGTVIHDNGRRTIVVSESELARSQRRGRLPAGTRVTVIVHSDEPLLRRGATDG